MTMVDSGKPEAEQLVGARFCAESSGLVPAGSDAAPVLLAFPPLALLVLVALLVRYLLPEWRFGECR